MNGLKSISRRRALTVIASLTGAALLPTTATRCLGGSKSVGWNGVVMNSPASLQLYCNDQAHARNALDRAVAEAYRLERIFSLYDLQSAICRLNASGRLIAPPAELVTLLSEAHAISVATDGAFDATMQPLWALYADHFARHPDDRAGPSHEAISRACRLVDYRAVSIASGEIAFRRPGMAISLNGIAQGFLTDRVTELLRAEGFTVMVVDLGEPRMTGYSPAADRRWLVTVTEPGSPEKMLRRLSVTEGAIATSQGAGTVFEPTGRHHHLFNPRTGFSASHYRSMTVTADTAARADGLSTGLSIVEPQRIAEIARQFPDVGVFAQLQDRTFLELPRKIASRGGRTPKTL